MKNKVLILVSIVVVLFLASFSCWYFHLAKRVPANSNNVANQDNSDFSKLVATTFYSCDSGLTIKAEFFTGPSKPATSPDQPPVPGGSVMLTLSDGQNINLSQTTSADGGRYATTDDSFVFWDKGNSSFIMKNNQVTENCLNVKDDAGGLPEIYASSLSGFSMRYPTGYTVKKDYVYQQLGPGKDINGISFTIPESMAKGTNLGADSYLSVEKISNSSTCDASLFLDPVLLGKSTIISDDNVDYSMASSTGAGAGNRYEETVYAISGTNPCLAIRYFIHYSVLENYPVGAVKAFDHAQIIKEFDAMRRSITIAQ